MNYLPDISIIIPFLNEESNLPVLGQQLINFSQSNAHISFEVILVNDGSTDKSKEIIVKVPFPQDTRLINLSQNFGSHAALRAGLTVAKGRYITFLYADLQDPIENVIKMYEKISKGKNIVWGFRNEAANSGFEKLFSRLYARLMKKYVN